MKPFGATLAPAGRSTKVPCIASGGGESNKWALTYADPQQPGSMNQVSRSITLTSIVSDGNLSLENFSLYVLCCH